MSHLYIASHLHIGSLVWFVIKYQFRLGQCQSGIREKFRENQGKIWKFDTDWRLVTLIKPKSQKTFLLVLCRCVSAKRRTIVFITVRRSFQEIIELSKQFQGSYTFFGISHLILLERVLQFLGEKPQKRS